MASDLKDDVDRLFECFKCGVSTPQSAAISSRKKRRKDTDSLTRERGSYRSNLEEAIREEGPRSSSIKQDNLKSLVIPVSSTKKFNGRNQISPVVFYGSPHGVPAKKPLQLLRLLREIRVDLTEQNDLSARKDVWATFPKQVQAMNFAKNHTQVHIFSYQDHLTGQRRFLVSTYEEFWQRYKVMDSKFRHHYEVIQEGQPCHMYFDLEFDRRINTGKDGDEMVDILISVIFTALHEKYSIEAESKWIVELDSSTDEKFSRHLLIRIPGAAFKDNSHVGAFVAEICSRISDARSCNPSLQKLYISKDSSGPEDSCHLFVDTAVYSRNRCFRLALSSKAGKKSVLLPSGRFKCKDRNEDQMFMDSLICRMDVDCKKLLICKMDLECMKTLHFDSEVHRGGEKNLEGRKDIILNTRASDFSGAYITGKSPFPALDRFVESIASSGNVSGQIRCWYWFSEFGFMVYSMSSNRYCERIGREHKSNNVIYVVDFRTAGYYQKCHDPDCKGYRSPLRPIPLDIIPNDANIYYLTKTSNFKEQIGLSNAADGSDIYDENVSDSCKKNGAWWHEAIKLADDLEKMRKQAEFHEQDLGFCDDQEWWMDAERSASFLEQQFSVQITYENKGENTRTS
ncbi:hypothetical protein H6P81_008218 [Aristolochia fimbriata]|uniref:DNA-directed primase/polymerase protein n=1 Tax=Aristolochia fimbriata TaxID=158543 RepID=A0AAV7F3M4_ARIFI|nr:hypothetical protein H6P81_008218 [Aristolochia fimbriata]